MRKTIIPAAPAYLDGLLELWKEYQTFYQVQDIDEEKNRRFVSAIIGDNSSGQIFLMINEDKLIGFGTLYFTYASTSAQRVAVLNDLYVKEEYRSKGHGKSLLDWAIDFCKEKQIPSMRWMTQTSNKTAQKLYKNYADPTEWLLYSVKNKVKES